MALRCFLFSSDEGTAALVGQVLSNLGLEAESCSDAVVAAEKITNQAFQIVIIDWDQQPEASLLLTTARERKASERPLTLAIVGDDKSVPTVLQAGANSILRKPIVVNQAKDTLTTARDLLKAKHESGSGASLAAAASATRSSVPVAPKVEPKEHAFRAGEFLVTAPTNPGGAFETESDVSGPSEQSSVTPVDALKELEPVASSVTEKTPEKTGEPGAPAAPGETRGLEWYLKTRGAARAPNSEAPKPSGNPDLIGFDQISTPSAKPAMSTEPRLSAPKPRPTTVDVPKREAQKVDEPRRDRQLDDQRKEAELFAYMDGERPKPAKTSSSGFNHKRAIVIALALAACGIAAAPQAPWHPKLRLLWSGGHVLMRAWLNPQPVTAVQEAPPAHENNYRPGDEYKLPVAENIPDATTDPSQIEVLPVVDPTAKKPNGDSTNPDQPTPPADGASTPITDASPSSVAESPAVQPSQISVVPAQPAGSAPATGPAAAPPRVASLPHSETPAPVVSTPAPPKVTPQPRYVTPAGNVPSSLKSQLAPPTNPDATDSKAPDTSLPSIEPVTVSEAAERALLTDQPAIPYPGNAKGQQGTVVLQVLIARDGTVQDAKFLQGSFLFARAAIDGVKQWKFKSYMLNSRPVSVQTTLTMKFKPGPVPSTP